MTKDVLGNDIKEGDTILLNNTIMTVQELRGGELLGGGSILDTPQGKKVTGIQMPAQMICTVLVQYDPNKPIGCYVLKHPSNQELASSNNNKGAQA